MTKHLTTILCVLALCGAGYAARYVDNGNGTVTDTTTGLMWTKDANLAGSSMGWVAATNYCATLTIYGYSDWRLPSVHKTDDATGSMSYPELDTLFRTNGSPYGAWEGTNGTPFINVQPGGAYDDHWSSTDLESEDLPFDKWLINMSDGSYFNDRYDWGEARVWPVRAGTFVAPQKAINPIPTNGAINQATNIVVNWSDGGWNVGRYLVSFGPAGSVAGAGWTTATNYDLGALIYGSNYQWRIDSSNVVGVTTGDVWGFTVMDEPPPAKPRVRASTINHVNASSIFRVKGRAE